MEYYHRVHQRRLYLGRIGGWLLYHQHDLRGGMVCLALMVQHIRTGSFGLRLLSMSISMLWRTLIPMYFIHASYKRRVSALSIGRGNKCGQGEARNIPQMSSSSNWTAIYQLYRDRSSTISRITSFNISVTAMVIMKTYP
ncbi:hypothetical protein P691DRAFT_189467 [Macrolepiota fuliginosa MF-IS2]|uniref:Uncharacterized protein n=1 Tax=Macrolepiota fuliginosa MF-IS2 TaxID=1400762 RepID=A0A9P5XAN6_9AGAR|nr:hypothetical protein P691DRAFT_189467 [Macrolepiota fuliginosa MF-IS2]